MDHPTRGPTAAELRYTIDRLNVLLARRTETRPSGPERRRELGLYTQREVSRIIGRSVHDYLHVGTLPVRPEAVLPGGRRKYFTREDVVKLLAWSREPAGPERAHEQRLRAGWYSQSDVATMCGVSQVTIGWHISKGRFAAPSHKIPHAQALYYNRDEAAQIRRVLRLREGWNNMGRRGRRSEPAPQ